MKTSIFTRHRPAGRGTPASTSIRAARSTSTSRIASLTIGRAAARRPPRPRPRAPRTTAARSAARPSRARARAVRDGTALELVRPPLALAERRRLRPARPSAPGPAAPRRRRDPRRPSTRTIGRCSVPARRTISALRPATRHVVPTVSRRGSGPRHVEAPVEAVRPADPAAAVSAWALAGPSLNRRCRRARGSPRWWRPL